MISEMRPVPTLAVLQSIWYKSGALPAGSRAALLTNQRDWNSPMAKSSLLEAPARVYKVVCLPTGKAYIGVTVKPLEWRWSQHRKEARATRFDTVLYRAMRLYGAAAFTIELLQEIPTGLEAQLVERELIARHNTMAPNGMNTSSGGENWAGITRSPEVRDKISASKKGKAIWSAEAKQAMSAARLGKKATEARLAGIRAANAKPEYRAARAAALKARWQDPEFRAIALANSAKTNEKRKGVPRTAEEKAKISANRRGIAPKWTEERKARNKARFEDAALRAKMGEHSKAYWDANPGERDRRSTVVSEMNRKHWRIVARKDNL